MSDLFQRHRITARQSGEPVRLPSEFKDSVTVKQVQHGRSEHLQIDTAGDLAPLLPWIDSLNLKQIRIEPLGLRVVYDSVHSGSATSRRNSDSLDSGNI